MAEYAEQRSKIFGALFNGYDTDRLGKRKIPVPGIGSGAGICEEEQEYIFDMFYKGDPTQKESYGLGLYVSKQILEAHGSRMCFIPFRRGQHILV